MAYRRRAASPSASPWWREGTGGRARLQAGRLCGSVSWQASEVDKRAVGPGWKAASAGKRSVGLGIITADGASPRSNVCTRRHDFAVMSVVNDLSTEFG